VATSAGPEWTSLVVTNNWRLARAVTGARQIAPPEGPLLPGLASRAGERDGNDVGLLLLTPWLSWLKEPRKAYTPQVQDYPLQDSQLDLEICLHTQQAMMNALQAPVPCFCRRQLTPEDAETIRPSCIRAGGVTEKQCQLPFLLPVEALASSAGYR